MGHQVVDPRLKYLSKTLTFHTVKVIKTFFHPLPGCFSPNVYISVHVQLTVTILCMFPLLPVSVPIYFHL